MNNPCFSLPAGRRFLPLAVLLLPSVGISFMEKKLPIICDPLNDCTSSGALERFGKHYQSTLGVQISSVSFSSPSHRLSPHSLPLILLFFFSFTHFRADFQNLPFGFKSNFDQFLFVCLFSSLARSLSVLVSESCQSDCHLCAVPGSSKKNRSFVILESRYSFFFPLSLSLDFLFIA